MSTLEHAPRRQRQALLLVVSTLIMAICGLVYELLAGTLSSYLLGDSTTHFSLVIGCFLSSMGAGSWLSRFVTRHHFSWLIGIEIALGILGGTLALLGFVAFTYTQLYLPFLLGMTGVLGSLVGLEIPIVISVLKGVNTVKLNVSNVLCADYVGALLASLLFPFVLVPHLGLCKSGIVTGAANLAIALLLVARFRGEIGARAYRGLKATAIAGLVVLAGLYLTSTRMTSHMEDSLYQDHILIAKSTPHQRVVLTRWRDDLRLYLNGHLQFSSIDEYRYHETLVHVPMGAGPRARRVLILGGGDGLALREVLKYPQVQAVTLVDLDPEVTRLFSQVPQLTGLNDQAFADPRVQVRHQDAMQFLHEDRGHYDVILSDLPDPSDAALAKLYAKSFFGLAARKLLPGGRIMVQSTSPFRARKAFWCIHNTLAAVSVGGRQLEVQALHTQIPSFGTWGFNLASFAPIDPSQIQLSAQTRYLNQSFLPRLFEFPSDMQALPAEVSTLDAPVVARYYQHGYHQYLQ